jgi:hypothetical protein
MSSVKFLVQAVVYSFALSIGSSAGTVVSMSQNDEGVMKNCCPDGDLSVRWSPAVIRTGENLSIKIAVTAGDSFDHGQLCNTVWLNGVPEPVYLDCPDVTACNIVRQLKFFFPDLKCPIEKGEKISYSNPAFPILPTYPLPAGKFHFNVTLSNDKNKCVMCMYGDIEIQND